jgi:hypothetical protein
MTSGTAIWAGAGASGRAWMSNENIEATTPQTKIEATFNIDRFPYHGSLIGSRHDLG